MQHDDRFFSAKHSPCWLKNFSALAIIFLRFGRIFLDIRNIANARLQSPMVAFQVCHTQNVNTPLMLSPISAVARSIPQPSSTHQRQLRSLDMVYYGDNRRVKGKNTVM